MKFLFISTLLWGLFWVMPGVTMASGQGPNLLRNEGFEEPTEISGSKATPDFWERRPGSGVASIIWDHNISHSGKASGFVEGGELETRAGWQQGFSIRPESRYQITGWVKTDPPGSRYIIGLEYLDRRGVWVSRHNLLGKTDNADWRLIREEFLTPIDAVRCRITLRAWSKGQEKIGAWFDDLEVLALPPASTPARPGKKTRRLTRPVTIGKKGELRVRGRPFFPIGIYDAPPEAFPGLQEWHFNTVVTGGGDREETARILDQAWQYQLRAIHSPGDGVTTPEGREAIAAAARRFKTHPALLAWYPIDEPEINGVPKEPVEQAYHMIHQEDGHHPVFQTLYYPSAYPIFASGRDVLAIDPYPVPIRPLISIARAMLMAQKQADRQPVWLIPQAFYGLIWTRPPEPEELRCMVYIGLVHGAKGIIYYTYGVPGQPTQWQLTSSPLWPAIRALNREIQEVAPALLMGVDVPVKVEAAGRLKEDWRGDPAIHALAKRWRGKIYLLAVNLAEEPVESGFGSAPVTAAFRLDGPRKGCVSLPFEGRKVVMREGVFSDQFEPYGVHVYWIMEGG